MSSGCKIEFECEDCGELMVISEKTRGSGITMEITPCENCKEKESVKLEFAKNIIKDVYNECKNEDWVVVEMMKSFLKESSE